MRYVIIGAGAIGGTVAGRLAEHSSPHPPLLIARGDNLAAIADAGLRLRSAASDLRIRVPHASGPDRVTLRTDDVLVLATKTQQALAALTDWVDRPVLEPGAGPGAAPVGSAGDLLPLVIAMNGVAGEAMALRRFDRVFAACVWLPAVHLVPGEVLVRIAPISGEFLIGRYGRAAGPDDVALLETLAQDWNSATFRVHAVADVMRWKYAKLLSNLGNALQALTGPEADYAWLYDRIRSEAEEILRRAGIDWASRDEEAARRGDTFRIRPIPGVDGARGGSSWQSLARGTGDVEADYLNGEIAYRARELGVEAPLNAALQALTRRAAASGAPAGSMTVAEVAALIGAGQR